MALNILAQQYSLINQSHTKLLTWDYILLKSPPC